MSEENLDALLERMAAIAEAVNAFSSEAVQQAAFQALVSAFHGSSKSNSIPPAGDMSDATSSTTPIEEAPTGGAEGAKAATKKPAAKRKAGSGNKDFQFVRDLDLRPEGKQSFSDFIATKQPSSNEDKYAAAVYYLQHVLELPSVTSNHVGSVFRLEPSWREPGDLLAGLRVTGNRKGTIDTSSWENLRMTPHGRNFVEHDLPRAPKKPKK